MAACLARSSLVWRESGEAGSPHRPRDVDDQQHPGALALLAPPVEQVDQHVGVGHLEQRLGLVGIDAVGRADRVADGHLGVAGPEVVRQHLLLVVGLLHEVDEQLSGLALLGGDPRRVEHVEGVVAEERALLGVDGHQRDARRARLLAGVELAVGVALVVVDDRLLLDGHGGRVLQRGALLVGPVPVVEVGERGVAVVGHGRLDTHVEGVHLGLGQVFEGEVALLARGRVVLGDQGREARGREVGVGLAQPERTPLGVAELGPAGRGCWPGRGRRSTPAPCPATPGPRPWAWAWP